MQKNEWSGLGAVFDSGIPVTNARTLTMLTTHHRVTREQRGVDRPRREDGPKVSTPEVVVHQVVRHSIAVLLLHSPVRPERAQAQHRKVCRNSDVQAQPIAGLYHGLIALPYES
jgi:hypothetical protein